MYGIAKKSPEKMYKAKRRTGSHKSKLMLKSKGSSRLLAMLRALKGLKRVQDDNSGSA